MGQTAQPGPQGLEWLIQQILASLSQRGAAGITPGGFMPGNPATPGTIPSSLIQGEESLVARRERERLAREGALGTERGMAAGIPLEERAGVARGQVNAGMRAPTAEEITTARETGTDPFEGVQQERAAALTERGFDPKLGTTNVPGPGPLTGRGTSSYPGDEGTLFPPGAASGGGSFQGPLGPNLYQRPVDREPGTYPAGNTPGITGNEAPMTPAQRRMLQDMDKRGVGTSGAPPTFGSTNNRVDSAAGPYGGPAALVPTGGGRAPASLIPGRGGAGGAQGGAMDLGRLGEGSIQDSLNDPQFALMDAFADLGIDPTRNRYAGIIVDKYANAFDELGALYAAINGDDMTDPAARAQWYPEFLKYFMGGGDMGGLVQQALTAADNDPKLKDLLLDLGPEALDSLMALSGGQSPLMQKASARYGERQKFQRRREEQAQPELDPTRWYDEYRQRVGR